MSPHGGLGQWSPRVCAVVAKTDPQSELTLDLPAHLCDTMAVAQELWSGFLPSAVKAFLADELGSEASAAALVRFVSGIHDVGKASDTFQRSLPSWSTTRLRDHGIRLSASQQKVPHGTLGQVALKAWLQRTFSAGPGARDLAEVIGGHHGLNPTTADSSKATREYLPLEPPVWQEVRNELIEAMADRSGARAHFGGWVDGGVSLPARVLLQGVVILADWIASNSEFFPYHDSRSHQERASCAIDALALGEPWSPPSSATNPSELFAERFPSLSSQGANGVQLAAAEIAATAAGPCLLMIEARPGVGKTEAGLLAAEVLASRFGCGGVFIGLPTMATANPMFLRVTGWLQTMGGQVNSVNLAHGKAALNRDFAEFIRATSVQGVYSEDRVRVVSWLRGRKRNLLSNSVVGTIDQFLMGGLKARHLALRHLALAGKVVVIDEVHAADDFMREYALAMLEWLGRYHTPVILMSATLPPRQRSQFVAAYARGRGDVLEAVAEPAGYPSLTRYDGAVTVSVVPDTVAEVRVRVEQFVDSDEELAERLRRDLAEGGCAAVIRNTVGRAQQTYLRLKACFGDEVVLLHSRFIAPHRMDRERGLVAALGRGGKRPHRLIVVGTQVLEQSLDVDFDLMVTDLAPIDLLLQRAGRLHRHPRRGRPPALRTPTLLVTGAEWDASPPLPVTGSVRVYGRARLLRAAAVLQTSFADGLLSVPSAIPGLVATGYAPALEAPAGWESAWVEAEAEQRDRSQGARQRAREFAITAPVDDDPMAAWLLAPADDPESPNRLGRAQVRDGSDSLEVIVLQRDADGMLRLPAGPGPMAGEAIAEFLPIDDWHLARAMAETTVSLPQSMCANPAQVDRTILALERGLRYDNWQSSPWIAGQLALVLDPRGCARVADFDITYTDELGLTATRGDGAA